VYNVCVKYMWSGWSVCGVCIVFACVWSACVECVICGLGGMCVWGGGHCGVHVYNVLYRVECVCGLWSVYNVCVE